MLNIVLISLYTIYFIRFTVSLSGVKVIVKRHMYIRVGVNREVFNFKLAMVKTCST